MHLIRLLLSGVEVLQHGFVPLRVDGYRDRLLAIRRGDVSWEEVERWRLELHKELDEALRSTSLPEHPDYQCANDFLIRARRHRCFAGVRQVIDYQLLLAEAARHANPLLFITISGAHLCGFPSQDSDYDLRGVHILPAKEAVGLHPKQETIEFAGVRSGIDMTLSRTTFSSSSLCC